MAEITFGVNNQQNITASGLGFYGATHGASVQIGSYQDTTFVTNDTGSDPGPAANNVKFINAATGNVTTDFNSGIPLTRINAGDCTFHINFDHSAAVRVQNAQLVVYDRSNTQYPASGVVTKVAELANFLDKAHGISDWHYPDNTGAGNTAYGAAYGSGDCFWWGSPWPASFVSASDVARYTNSSGVKFYNGDDSDSDINGDQRLSLLTTGRETVGGTGVIVPLLNSPGSGGQWLNVKNAAAIQGATTADQTIQPKWYQYSTGVFDGNDTVGSPGIDPASHGAKSTDGNAYATHGGTGVDKRHTWFVAMSASPQSIGSKTDYGLYVSLEYL